MLLQKGELILFKRYTDRGYPEPAEHDGNGNGKAPTLIRGFADLWLSGLPHNNGFSLVIPGKVILITTCAAINADLFHIKMTKIHVGICCGV